VTRLIVFGKGSSYLIAICQYGRLINMTKAKMPVLADSSF